MKRVQARTFRMKSVKALAPLVTVALGLSYGCSTTVEPPAAPLPEVPEYTKVRHPAGTDVMDLRAVFLNAEAPTAEQRKTCDEKYQKLKSLTANSNEVESGVFEMVSEDPVAYHWCFYAKLLELYDSVKEIPSMKDRQTKVLESFMFLAPVARSYHTKFNDSRYLRMAIYHYKFFSQWVFFRKLDVTPEMTNMLAAGDIKNPFGFYRPTEEATSSVLEKYGLSSQKAEPARVPASMAPTGPAPAAAAPAVPVAPAAHIPAQTPDTSVSDLFKE